MSQDPKNAKSFCYFEHDLPWWHFFPSVLEAVISSHPLSILLLLVCIWQTFTKFLCGLPRWHLVVKNLPSNAGDTETRVWSLGQEYPLEEEIATHSSILAWRIPWTEEPGGLQSLGLKRVRHDWAHAHTHTCTHANTHAHTLNATYCSSPQEVRIDKNSFLWHGGRPVGAMGTHRAVGLSAGWPADVVNGAS